MAQMTMRSGEEIKRDVKDRLFWDSRVECSDIRVEVKEDGTVTLSGTVPTYCAWQYAAVDALSTPGVRTVDNRLAVRPAGISKLPSDAELESNVKNLLLWSSSIDSEKIRVSVNAGVVRLEGDVEAYWLKERAGILASDVLGVSSVDNRIAVVPTLRYKDEAIAKNILSTLDRTTGIDVGLLNVLVENGEVTISWP
ncbi:MAG: BON domain-containing protein, partial [Endomicrobiales bacterium]